MASKYVRRFVAGCGLVSLGIVQGVPAQLVASGPSLDTRKLIVTVDADWQPLQQVLEQIARQAGLTPVYGQAVTSHVGRVTLHVRNMAVTDAFTRALRGTGLQATIGGNDVVFERNAVAIASGSIAGRVTDAATQQPLRGVTLMLDDSPRGTQSGNDGRFHLLGVTAGSHRITARLLGYQRHTNAVTVIEGEAVQTDFGLVPTTNTLDQVVVTGTIIPTELKAVPNAITVITAKDIEQRGITHIDQLFRGDVPGLFAQNRGSIAPLDEVTMFSRGATALSNVNTTTVASDGSTTYTNPIKTYVDGVELADPKYLSQIDPKSIERIEILTGPQASTIYGSNALNGVMQIFTKRGASNTPQLTLNLLSGWVENNLSAARTPQHDDNAQLSGVEGGLSYNAGGSWNYMGPWTPAKQTTRTGGSGGARLTLPTAVGLVTADLTLRRSNTQNRQRGSQFQPLIGYVETGWYNRSSSSGLSQPTTYVLTGQTLGMTLAFAPTDWWSQELGVGQDLSDMEQRYTARGYLSIADTTLYLSQSHTDRHSLRYTVTTRVPMTSFIQATVIGGADAWQNLSSSLRASPQTLTGTLASTSYTVTRQPGHNTGGFLQAQVTMNDRLFLTYGLRAEWNPTYGKDAQPNYAPRYGVAYTQEVGPLTAKFRTSYGRSTRPPQANLKVAHTIAEVYGSGWVSLAPYFLPYYGGIYDYTAANADLAPEHQQGGEGGVELYLGTRASLVVTRYNQTVDGLIANALIDSVRSLVPCPVGSCISASLLDADGYGYEPQFQYVNLGSIRNQGWELQGSMNTGPFTTKGTYSWTKSRTLGVSPKYRSQFTGANGFPQYEPGATFQYLPEHTWALGVTYAHAMSNIALNVTGTGRTRNLNNAFFYQNLSSSIRLPQNRFSTTGSQFGPYVNFNPDYTMADLSISHRFTPRIESLLQVQNLTDRYTNDYSAQYATLGRQTKFGARVRL